jgi:hypothetical protein
MRRLPLTLTLAAVLVLGTATAASASTGSTSGAAVAAAASTPKATATPTAKATAKSTPKPTATPTTKSTPKPTPTKPAAAAIPVGSDVSDPQGAGPYSAKQAFGIVGVNWPNAAKANPYRTTEIDWALGTTGKTAQPKVQLYVLGAEPGKAAASTWPKTNTASNGKVVTNPYGKCANTDSTACTFIYGYNLAVHDTAFVSHPTNYRWWLDIETAETWQTNTTAGHQRNEAAIEGMLAAFKAAKIATVGIYSTGYQWGRIAGAVPATSTLAKLPNWIPIGVGTAAQAKKACTDKALMHGKVVMTQFVTGSVATGTDHDVSCV